MKFLVVLSIVLSILLLNTGCKSPNYTMEDFNKIQKIDAHVHDNSEGTAFIDIAAQDGFKILSINVDYPDFPKVEFQQKVSQSHLKNSPDRFAFVSTFYMTGLDDPDWVKKTISHLDSTIQNGAVAVKVWKNIGMVYRDKDNKLVMMDDSRLDPIFNYLMQKNIPVICHCGEPRDCWLAVDKMMSNDMKIYFTAHPHYHMFLHPEMPSYEAQIGARNKMLDKNPDMTFVGAHIGSLEWSIDELEKFLVKYPNASVDLAARMDYIQLQSQKDYQKVRDFFIKYKDRLLYGSDLILGPNDDPKVFKQVVHDKWLSDWKFLATDSVMNLNNIKDSFKGLSLPKEVINSLYFQNAGHIYKTAFQI